MISRVADECFWLGRYIERAESTARALAAMRMLALDAGPSTHARWQVLLALAGEEGSFAGRHGAAALEDGEQVEQSLTWEPENGGSIARSLAAARENARAARDVITLEVWEALNELFLWMQGAEAREDFALHRFGFYARVRANTQLVLGQTQSTMLHDAALDFVWLGVFLERASWTARLLGAQPGAPEPTPIREEEERSASWFALLRACSALEPFVRGARGQINGLAICRFLVLETRFPRSILYCVRAARTRLAALQPGEVGEGFAARRALAKLEAEVAGVSLAAIGPDTYHGDLARTARACDEACDAITRDLLCPPVARTPIMSGEG